MSAKGRVLPLMPAAVQVQPQYIYHERSGHPRWVVLLGLKVVFVRMSKRDSLYCHLNLLSTRIYFIEQLPQLANYTLISRWGNSYN